MLTLDDLKQRKTIAEICLEILKTVPDSDNRKVGAMDYIQKQLNDIERNIKRIEAGGTVVGLKTAVLFGKVDKLS